MLQTFLGDILNVAFSSCEQEEPGLLGLALEEVKEPRARGGCGSSGGSRLPGLVVPTRRVPLSPEAVCHSKTNTPVLWVPSQYCSNPIPWGA